MKKLTLAGLLLVGLFFALAGKAQERLLTLEDIYHPEKKISFEGAVPIGFAWLKDNVSYVERVDEPASPLVRVSAETGARTPLFDATRLQSALVATAGVTEEDARKEVQAATFILSPDESALLLQRQNDLYYYSISEGRLIRLTDTPESEKEAQFSPDGRRVAFVRGNDLHCVEVAGGGEKRLTQDGSDTLLNAILDWIYQEEVYGRGKFRAFWWSPDSSRLAFLQLSEEGVPKYPIVHDTDLKASVEETYYPRSGEPNPRARLGVVSVADGKLNWVGPDEYGQEETLIVRVAWTPDSKAVAYQVQNREQTRLDLNLYDVSAGASRRLVRETSPSNGGWVNVLGQPSWLKDESFLWLSDRDGVTRLYHLSAQGEVIHPVTPADMRVDESYGIDQTKGWVYFSSRGDGVDKKLYRTSLDGGQVTPVTTEAGEHEAEFNAVFSLFLDTWSDVKTPPVASIRLADGTVVRPTAPGRENPLKKFRLSAPEFVRVPTSDGHLLDAYMIKPFDFRSSRKYPVLVYTYGGPEAPASMDRWADRTFLWHEFLASKGYLIWVVDPRSSSAKGVKWTYPIYRRMGEMELRDLEDSLTWLKKKPFVDGARIGMWGWSYGGFMTSYALTHSKSFKAGIAGAPVTDWHFYDSIYTERYMGLPKDNVDGYDKTSVVKAAANLQGRLLVIYGLIDDNVHPQNSVQFIYELQKAGKQFDLMMYPNSRHGVTMPAQVYHLRRLMTDFLMKNL